MGFRAHAEQSEKVDDDGRKLTQTNDIQGNENWTFQTNLYETDGTTQDFLETRWDNGSTQIIPY